MALMRMLRDEGGLGRRPPRRRGPVSGQALVEAALTLTVLAFTWMFASYLCFQADHRIRTAAAGRHVAWMHGNTGVAPIASTVESRFFITALAERFDRLDAPSSSQSISIPSDVSNLSMLEPVLRGNSPLGPVWLLDRNTATLFMSTSTLSGYPYAITAVPFGFTRPQGEVLETPGLGAASPLGRAGRPQSAWPRIAEVYHDYEEIKNMF